MVTRPRSNKYNIYPENSETFVARESVCFFVIKKYFLFKLSQHKNNPITSVFLFAYFSLSIQSLIFFSSKANGNTPDSNTF